MDTLKYREEENQHRRVLLTVTTVHRRHGDIHLPELARTDQLLPVDSDHACWGKRCCQHLQDICQLDCAHACVVISYRVGTACAEERHSARAVTSGG